MTNGDLIRALNNDKLVSLYILFRDGEIDYGGFCDACDQDHCDECLKS